MPGKNEVGEVVEIAAGVATKQKPSQARFLDIW